MKTPEEINEMEMIPYSTQYVDFEDEKIKFAMDFAEWLITSKVQFHLLPTIVDSQEIILFKQQELMRLFVENGIKRTNEI
jgi:hypothetical protein